VQNTVRNRANTLNTTEQQQLQQVNALPIPVHASNAVAPAMPELRRTLCLPLTVTALCHVWLFAVLQHGFKNSSLMVHNDITVATMCVGYNGVPKVPAGTYCEAPPLVNPATGTRMMDCATWYTNRTSVMVNCPTQPNCCRDDDCFDWNDHLETINFCG
jgi:hypothetical protein